MKIWFYNKNIRERHKGVDRILLPTIFKIHNHEIRIQNNFYLSYYRNQFHCYLNWLINNIVILLFVFKWRLPTNHLLLGNEIFLMDKLALDILKFFKKQLGVNSFLFLIAFCVFYEQRCHSGVLCTSFPLYSFKYQSVSPH